MDVVHEIVLSDEKFRSVGSLRELLCEIENLPYCSFGSFLSCIHFSQKYKSPFELLVEDESEVLDLLSKNYEVDTLHGTITLTGDADRKSQSSLKVRLVDASAKNELLRRYLIENSDSRTCLISNKEGEVEKFDIKIPRRGPTIISLLIEKEDSPNSTSEIVEKIVWSLTNVGVAPLLRESRFIPKEIVHQAADIIEDIFVAHANKTASMLHSHATGDLKSITAADLKKLGRPYAALLRA